ncbi:LacI family DNA-binding transcriptional regulator [Clostridium neuense]|uniref:LacI family DNA-binding transcriptional regulator n=1 Tax=Clostridium neuense TaxID=1728934 RepID=A0ABW8TMK9_9CLOT
MKHKKATISDIARTINVSSITVSRALRGEDGVSKELRDKIIFKAKALGYKKSKNNVNILILHEKTNLQDNPNFNFTLQCIETNLQNRNAEYSIEFVSKDKQNQKELPYKLLKGNYFDGILFIGRFNEDYINFLKSKVKCQVSYANYSPSLDCDTVRFDAANVTYKQCIYLLDNGHRRIGFIGNLSTYILGEKVLGMKAAMNKYKLQINKEFFIDNKADDFNKKLLKILTLEDRPTAIICQGDLTALKVIKLLHENNIKVPEDVSIIGKGNQEVASISIPALTTIDINIEYSCNSAIDLLMKRINDSEKPYENITINGFLIERDSVKKLTKGEYA